MTVDRCRWVLNFDIQEKAAIYTINTFNQRKAAIEHKNQYYSVFKTVLFNKIQIAAPSCSKFHILDIFLKINGFFDISWIFNRFGKAAIVARIDAK